MANNGDYKTHKEDTAALLGLLKACTKQKDLSKGSRIHADILQRGLLRRNIFIGNTLVNMYARCGAFVKAQQVFDELPFRTVVSWNALITGYAQHGYGIEALDCFEQMQRDGISPNAVTFTCILKACGSIAAAEKGKAIHDQIVREGLLGKDRVLGTALVDMYAKSGALAKAQEVFDELPVRNVVSWTALIAGYAQHGYSKEALDCLEQMQHEGFDPDAVTFSCVLKACGSIGAAEKGEKLYAEIRRGGLLTKSRELGNSLVDMYAKCGALEKAQQVFEELPARDVVSWSALIAGYAQYGHGEKALLYFERMQYEGLFPNAVTYLCILKACGSIGAAEKGKAIHAAIVNDRILGKDCVLGSALFEMYAKCGALEKAQQVFDELPARDTVSWNALISGYSYHIHGEEALLCFNRMQCEGVSPNLVTFACILKACGSIGATERGKDIHAEIVREGFLGKDCVLGNALVGMYAKCGALTKAQDVFDELPVRNVVSWNALLAGYVKYGHSEKVLNCFQQMQCKGISPDTVTFLCILRVCSSSGLVDEGQMYFKAMSTSHGIIPTLEHLTYMVDLFGLSGHFDKATAVIKQVPASYRLPLWFALLGGCRKWGNLRLGRLAFEHAIQLDEQSAVAYAYMNNIYAAAGMHEDADIIEVMRRRNDAWKLPGRCWWTDSSGIVHSFCVGDKGHSQIKNVCTKLQDISCKILQEGHCPDLHLVSISQDVKENALCGHGSIAFALNTPEVAPANVHLW